MKLVLKLEGYVILNFNLNNKNQLVFFVILKEIFSNNEY